MKKLGVLFMLLCVCANGFAMQNPDELFDSATQIGDTTQGIPVSIEDAVRIALQDNNSVKNAIKTRDVYRAQVKEYWSYVYPTLSLSGNYTRNFEIMQMTMNGQSFKVGYDNTFTAGLDADWVLWSGGKVKAGVRIAKEVEKMGEYNLRSVRDSIEREVTNMCYAIILANAVSKVQEGHLEIAKQNLAEMKAKYKQGLSSNLDLLSQEVNVANIEPLVIQANNNYELGNLYLKRLLNRDPEDNIFLSWNEENIKLPEVMDLDKLYMLSEENRADLVLAKINMNIAEKQITIARSDHMPTISAFANKYYNGQTYHGFPQHSEDYYWTSAAGVRLSLPLFEGFKVNSVVEQKKLEYEQAKQDYEDTKKQVRIGIKAAWLNLIESKKRMSSGVKVIDQSKENLESMRKRYRAGLSSRLELDDAAIALTNAQLTYVQAVHDAFNALADLKFAVGTEVRK
ncbi:outer membrane protein TolC [Elusimicrobium posterum]|uniref:TolC family protein n=1 Tax=Elusimicrobium posterum TaxID=3116653 RepID=UPI003C76AFD0